MKRYDVYRIMAPEHEEGGFPRGPVAVYETHGDERTARERAAELNDGLVAPEESLVVFEVRERGSEETLTTYDVCAVPSPFVEDKWTGTDTVRYETGYETREAAEKRVRDLNDARRPSERMDLVYDVGERAI